MAITIFVISENRNKNDIEKTINNRGGIVLSIDRRIFNIHPFNSSYRHSIYKIEYKDSDDTIKEAWMKTDMFDNQWVWYYEESK